MENTYTSPGEITNIRELKSDKESKINSLVNNLKIKDVEDDKAFENTINSIKRAVLINPVVLQEPEFVDHKYSEKRLSFTDQVAGLSKDHYYHEVSFPFTGSKEIFLHQPEDGFSWSSSEYGLIMPRNSSIRVYVDLPQLDPEKAKSEARRLLSMTLQFVDKNNRSVESWNAGWSSRIETQLKNKREELIKLFGVKK